MSLTPLVLLTSLGSLTLLMSYTAMSCSSFMAVPAKYFPSWEIAKWAIPFYKSPTIMEKVSWVWQDHKFITGLWPIWPVATMSLCLAIDIISSEFPKLNFCFL